MTGPGFVSHIVQSMSCVAAKPHAALFKIIPLSSRRYQFALLDTRMTTPSVEPAPQTPLKLKWETTYLVLHVHLILLRRETKLRRLILVVIIHL